MGDFQRFINEFNVAANELDHALSAVGDSPASLTAVHRARERLIVVSNTGNVPATEVPAEQLAAFVGRSQELRRLEKITFPLSIAAPTSLAKNGENERGINTESHSGQV